ncbi:hypothetical protein GE061_000463 [Apolygus lucorum]|uniref:Uncharacterized protein n=1 Tax=Apolygus lucorum TaxID=248454 RepID=A0A6A4KMI3_APOLU|nr:hypothetical protein GE061_000463 [Apolygus lucorum]
MANYGSTNMENVLKKWEKAYSEASLCENVEKKQSDDLELYSAAYHKLVHSPALDTILQTEHTFATVIHRLVKQRDEELDSLASKQTEEMSKALEGLSLGLTEADITAVAKRQQEEHGIEIASWESQLEIIRNSQKVEYRTWLMSLLELSYDSPLITPISSPVNESRGTDEVYNTLGQTLQESFTIHLGSQMKQMYNIRILSADVMDFCMLRTNDEGELERQPQRMQTALGLYSNDLSGIVLLSDNHFGGFSGVTKDFVGICEMSTELHFPSVEEQLESVREYVKEGIEWRKINAICDTNLLSFSEQQLRKSSTKYLQIGDVFITRHSNLSDAHVVFHMVADDSLKSGDITSRHPAILGLRNVMKCACSNDVTTLTIPILLSHDMTEDMSLSWCSKRAELVYKCVKGFMIEMASWGGSELKNLQFLVPTSISEDIFTSLAGMVPSIFRVSNPLVLKANA